MRTRITRKAWFGPRRRLRGWGLRPVSWEGWLSTGVFAGLEIVSRIALTGTAKIAAALVVLLLYLGVIALTADPPGRARAGRGRR